jgi:hypothetical protein
MMFGDLVQNKKKRKKKKDFIFEGGLQFSKLFKMTISKGMCPLKCNEKRVILFTPLHLLHKFVPHTEFKGSPGYVYWNVL